MHANQSMLPSLPEYPNQESGLRQQRSMEQIGAFTPVENRISPHCAQIYRITFAKVKPFNKRSRTQCPKPVTAAKSTTQRESIVLPKPKSAGETL
ncbi:hypothetical protein CDAR_112531 [Caerostris darwini]|uniref:Uncharacterized protein n=1 Tax=Caerostris darwini TaxID=1538125 RepID=A0AAV4Q1M1_9ARAC|nr:hypothetical protein CDAR_112531 [Caerostris darwini]